MPEPRKLLPQELAEQVRAAGQALVVEALSMTPEVAQFGPKPGEWCAHEILGHMIEAERRGFHGRIRQILDADNPKLPTWDQEAVAKERNDSARRLPDLVKEFQDQRRESVRLVFRLREPDLARGGVHETIGPVTVGELIQEWVYHDRDHVRQLYANVQAYALQYMGATRKFYE